MRLAARKAINRTPKIKINRLFAQHCLSCCGCCLHQIGMGIGRCCDQNRINRGISNNFFAGTYNRAMCTCKVLCGVIKFVRHGNQITLRMGDNINRMDLTNTPCAQQTYFKHSVFLPFGGVAMVLRMSFASVFGDMHSINTCHEWNIYSVL